MKIVIDMNLSPDWIDVLREAGHEAVHWSTEGSARATDREILAWARERGYVVFTHDLDFGAQLEEGALISLDEGSARARILPIA